MAKSATELEREIRDALGGCSLTVRGLWHEMRFLIEQHQDQDGGRPGHLQRNGGPIPDGQLARCAGCPSRKVTRLLQELADAGLIRRSDEGRCWFAPHLARLHAVRAGGAARVRRFRQKAGGDGPAKAGGRRPGSVRAAGVLRNVACNADVTPAVTPMGPAPSSPASSLPRTPSLTPPSSPPPPGDLGPTGANGRRVRRAEAGGEPGLTWALAGMPLVPEVLRTPAVLAALDDYVAYRRERKPKLTPIAAGRLLRRMEPWGPDRALAALELSMANSWQGVFEQSERSNGHGTQHQQTRPDRPHAFAGGRRRLPDVDPHAA